MCGKQRIRKKGSCKVRQVKEEIGGMQGAMVSGQWRVGSDRGTVEGMQWQEDSLGDRGTVKSRL